MNNFNNKVLKLKKRMQNNMKKVFKNLNEIGILHNYYKKEWYKMNLAVVGSSQDSNEVTTIYEVYQIALLGIRIRNLNKYNKLKKKHEATVIKVD